LAVRAVSVVAVYSIVVESYVFEAGVRPPRRRRVSHWGRRTFKVVHYNDYPNGKGLKREG
jgi:hypothetical protein